MRHALYRATVILFVALIPARMVVAQQAAPLRLTLQEAIHRALVANLNVLTASTRVDEAAGARARSFSSAMLPRVNAEVYSNFQNHSLAAQGFHFKSLPGIPSVVGPLSNYDFRIFAQQNVVDLQSYRALKASEQTLDAGKMDEQNARDLIVRAVASLYLNAQSAQARVDSAHSRVTDSNTLYKLAKDRHDAGTATGVDVLRAQVQLANDKQVLLEERNWREIWE